MLRVEPRQEPPNFDQDVRKPGLRAIAEGREKLPPYWRRCSDELRLAYDSLCAYSCLYIFPVTGTGSVDHFAPKSARRELAYEWSNYRLACSLMNSRKQVFENVLDPFEIEEGWFELEFVFMQVRPARHLNSDIVQNIEHTIDRLRLNDEECRTARVEWFEQWSSGEVDDRFMERCAPHIYREAVRQGLDPARR